MAASGCCVGEAGGQQGSTTGGAYHGRWKFMKDLKSHVVDVE